MAGELMNYDLQSAPNILIDSDKLQCIPDSDKLQCIRACSDDSAVQVACSICGSAE